MVDQIHNLREDKRFADALELLITRCKTIDASKTIAVQQLLRWHLFRRCLVLDWAVQQFQEKRRSQCLPVLDTLQSVMAPLLGQVRPQFTARLALIRAGIDGQNEIEDLKKAIVACVKATEMAWNYCPSSYVSDAELNDFAPTPQDTRNGPLFLWDLNDGYRELFQSLAYQYGWLHPGLLLAGETLAQLEGVAPTCDHSTKNYIMLTYEAGANSLGLLAPLSIERISDGRGFPIPDAFCSAYLQMHDTFSLGLQNAWYAWRLSMGSQPACDLRWHIDLDAAIRKTILATQLNLPLSGHSAEGILTCGFRAAAQGQNLDRNTTMTARLAQPIEASLALEKIDGVDLKCLAPQFLSNFEQFCERRRRRHIDNVIISHRQPEEDYDTGGPQKFTPVRSIFNAEAEFQMWPTITAEVKNALAEQALQHRLNLCGPEPASKEEREQMGCSYVQSPVAYRPTRQMEAEEKLIMLDHSATRDFVLGRWRPPDAAPNSPIRLRLFADSGMGKSVQLVACEHQIAEQPGEMVPIRIGKSDTHRVKIVGSTSIQTIKWGESDKEILDSLLRNCLAKAYPQRFANRASEWIERKAKNGELFFLIDALDQTSGDLELLAKFLDRYPQCPVVAADRPETILTRGTLFAQQQQWHTLDLQPLQRSQQRELLGTTLAEDWVLSDDANPEPHAWTSDLDRRKYEVEDLLSTPLLVQLLKRLLRKHQSDSNELKFRNRYELYELAAAELLSKGLQTQPNSNNLSNDTYRYERAFQQLALTMHIQQNFSQSFEGEAFENWQNELERSKLSLDDLVQADLVTKHSILERVTLIQIDDPTGPREAGIEWRHLSFQEYFAAKELRRLWIGSLDERRRAEEILRDIHTVLSDTGEFRQWRVWDNQAAEYVHKFIDQPTVWRWTLRFLLCSLESASREQLVLKLLEFGNPWVVYQCITEDRLKLGSLDLMTRWLVHREWSSKLNYTVAIKNDLPTIDQLKSRGLALDGMLDRTTRDASWLSPLRELVGDAAIYNRISRESSLLEKMRELHGSNKSKGTWNFMESFVPISGGTFNISRYESQDSSRRELVQMVFEIPNFALSDFPVTNELFELFCPTHRRWRDQLSRENDQPAIYVSWFMAQEFCYWLSSLTSDEYRLPSEWEWEWACRWLCGQQTQHCRDNYWWGPTMNDSLCWYGVLGGKGPAKHEQRTRGRQEAIDAFSRAERQHPSWQSLERLGLWDMSGNVLEWCQDWYEIGLTRVLRGGSWFFNAGACRSGSRGRNVPANRDWYSGFRLAAVLKSQAVQSSQQV